ncbi:MAG: SUMF1/EgtB/PvdO family nonheme iron enzyme [Verrucomicrobiota bacterium]
MTILFFDVNAATRGERALALAQQTGWKVTSIASVNEGRAWLAKARSLDLLITEAIIDEKSSGFALRDAALARFQNARVLFTTRYDLSGYEAKISGWPVLADAPYVVEKLIAKATLALEIAPPTQMLVPADSAPPPFIQPGTMLGQYQVLERLSYENESETYRAIQVSVQRPVALVLLRPELLHRPEVVERFKARERLKASITHTRIAPLYEAGEVSGNVFYTRELPRGRNLEELATAGETLSERRVAELLYGVAEAMDHAIERGCYHRRLEPRDVFIDDQGQASIVNIFRPADSRTRDPKEEVAALVALVEPLAAEGKAVGLVATLSEHPRDWAGLMDALDDVRDAMRERSIMRRIEAEEGGGNSSTTGIPWWFWVAAVVAVGGVFALGNLAGTATPTVVTGAVLKEPEMVEIPAGPFRYQKNERRNLPSFWISRHEVTLGQYADFLAALKKEPATKFDHPDQPKTKVSHIPPKWDDTYAAAKAGSTFNGQPISLNTPVTQVDWWDAYAYAKWHGMRLPTEEEWEKAARGEKGLPFPWGDKPARERANLGDDYDSNGKKKGGKVDGYNLFAPVDRKCEDISPYQIHDMAGNVSEWTASEFKGEPWPAHPDFPDLRVPVVRGGHFALKSSDDLLTTRFFAESASEITLARGFRVASDKSTGQ